MIRTIDYFDIDVPGIRTKRVIRTIDYFDIEVPGIRTRVASFILSSSKSRSTVPQRHSRSILEAQRVQKCGSMAEGRHGLF